MNLHDVVRSVADFDDWTHSDKIRFFAWALHSGGKHTFKASDIAACYAQLHAAPPTSVGSFLAAMVARKPPEALKDTQGYRLERRVRDDLDRRFGTRPTAAYVDALLAALPSRIPNVDQKKYLEEALACFRCGAFRAAIVMTWNLAYDHLCELVLAKYLSDFNAQLIKTFPKSDVSAIRQRDDFETLKESQVIQVCKSANIISGSVHKIAKEKLDRRNIAAHPSGVVITSATAEEFVRDLVENVVLKLL